MFRSGLRLAVVAASLLVVLVFAVSSAAEQPDDPGNSAEAPGQQNQPANPGGGNSAEAPGQVKNEAPAPETQVQAGGDGSGANQPGPYDPNGVGEPSGNGRSESNNGNRPCAGCVGSADDKNPPGQLPGGSDPNKGYECDENQGVGKTNPAHSGCGSTTTTTPPGGGPPGGGPPGGGPPGGGPPGGGPPGGGPPGNPSVGQPDSPQDEGPGAQDVLGQEEADEQGPGVREVATQPRERDEVVSPEVPVEGSLPFTGQELLMLLLLGALSLGIGLGIERIVPSRRLQP